MTVARVTDALCSLDLEEAFAADRYIERITCRLDGAIGDIAKLAEILNEREVLVGACLGCNRHDVLVEEHALGLVAGRVHVRDVVRDHGHLAHHGALPGKCDE